MESYVIALAVSSALVSLFAAIWGVRANMIQQNSIRYTTRNLTRNLTRGLTRISFPVAVEEILLKQISLLQRQLGSSELQIWLNEEKWEYFVKRITNTNWEETKNFPLEEFLEKLGAEQVENTLLMSRSVWHKLRESRPLEGLQLSDVLKGLHPARTPIPSRMSWLESRSETLPPSSPDADNQEQDLI